ncbi:MAG TPA: sigma-70 family RNA polymerase sigma factor, partial [Byssovorax sp.]
MNDTDLAAFERHRAELRALAYRMLGDTASAEDIVQEAWLRWTRRDAAVVVESARAYLLTVAARLCLNQLDSASARREEPRSWLPEPIEVEADGEAALAVMEQVSMAFLVALQRLTAAERAVLLLHEVFDLSHAEIAPRIGKTEAACRQLLRRARDEIAEQRSVTVASHAEHRRLLAAFAAASRGGDVDALADLL